MPGDISDISEARYAAEGFVPAAAFASLSRLRELCGLEPSHRTLRETRALASLAGKITGSFEAADEAELRGDEDSAALEWTRALVLMNRLAERCLGATAASFVCYQKSGRVG